MSSSWVVVIVIQLHYYSDVCIRTRRLRWPGWPGTTVFCVRASGINQITIKWLVLHPLMQHASPLCRQPNKSSDRVNAYSGLKRDGAGNQTYGTWSLRHLKSYTYHYRSPWKLDGKPSLTRTKERVTAFCIEWPNGTPENTNRSKKYMKNWRKMVSRSRKPVSESVVFRKLVVWKFWI